MQSLLRHRSIEDLLDRFISQEFDGKRPQRVLVVDTFNPVLAQRADRFCRDAIGGE